MTYIFIYVNMIAITVFENIFLRCNFCVLFRVLVVKGRNKNLLYIVRRNRQMAKYDLMESLGVYGRKNPKNGQINPEIEPLTGRYTSKFEQNLYSRTGMTLEQLFATGRLTDAYGRKLPPAPNGSNEREKMLYYHNYVAKSFSSGYSLMMYEKNNDGLPKEISFSEKNGLSISNDYVNPKEPKKPGFFARLFNTKSVKEYNTYLERKAESEKARKEEAEREVKHHNPRANLKQLREDNKEAMNFYLNVYNKDEFSVDPFTDEFSREQLINEIGNLMFMDSIGRMMKDDPEKADKMLANLQEQNLENAGKTKVMLNQAELDFVKSKIEHIQNPADLRNFMVSGGRQKLANEYAEMVKNQNVPITKPDFKIPTGQVKEDGTPVIDEQATKGYQNLCNDAKNAMRDLMMISATAKNGSLPANRLDDIKKGLATIMLQDMVAKAAVSKSQTTKDRTKDMLRQIADPNGDKSVYNGSMENVRAHLQKKMNIEKMTGKDIENFLKGDKSALQSSMIFGFLPSQKQPTAAKNGPQVQQNSQQIQQPKNDQPKPPQQQQPQVQGP